MMLPREVVLVHGAWHGAWCWAPVAALLAARGHQVHCPEWPGRGTGPACHLRLADAIAVVRETVAQCPSPPLVVAHSMAGMLLAAIISESSVTMDRAVFLAAHVPVSGDSAASLTRDMGLVALERCVLPDPDTCRVSLRRASARRLFYADVDPALAEEALDRLVPEPLAPMQDPVTVSAQAMQGVRCSYILCEDDAVLPAVTQGELAARWSMPVVRLPGSHSPFLARPEALLAALDKGPDGRG